MKPILNKTILCLTFLLSATSLFATDEMPDIVIYEGFTYYISGSRPKYFPLYPVLNNKKYTDKMEKDANGYIYWGNCYSTACARRYQAVWEIKDSTIYLKKVRDCCTEKPIFDLKKIFGDELTPNGVPATWIDGDFHIVSRLRSIFTISEEKEDIETFRFQVEKGRILSVTEE